MACAGTTTWGGLVRAGLKAGETAALVEAGRGLGHAGCQFAKAMALQVVGIDARDKGLDLARTSGAQIVIDARGGKEKVVEGVRKVTDGLGVDSALTVSDTPDTAALACAITKMQRRMVQIAQPPDVSILITVKTNPFFGLQEIPNLVELAHRGKMAGKGVLIVDEDEIRKEKERRQVS
ncbi:MAG: hypothetical protein Q9173_001139 [Seirophora scorigena]